MQCNLFQVNYFLPEINSRKKMAGVWWTYTCFGCIRSKKKRFVKQI